MLTPGSTVNYEAICNQIHKYSILTLKRIYSCCDFSSSNDTDCLKVDEKPKKSQELPHPTS